MSATTKKTGLDHLLHSGRGVGGETEEEAAELHVACFMGLVSFLANRHEVLRVATWNMKVIRNTPCQGRTGRGQGGEGDVPKFLLPLCCIDSLKTTDPTFRAYNQRRTSGGIVRSSLFFSFPRNSLLLEGANGVVQKCRSGCVNATAVVRPSGDRRLTSSYST